MNSCMALKEMDKWKTEEHRQSILWSNSRLGGEACGNYVVNPNWLLYADCICLSNVTGLQYCGANVANAMKAATF